MKGLPLYLLFFWLLAGCQKDITDDTSKATIKLQITHSAGSVPLALHTPYTNAFGETFTLTKYKYYISNIALTDERDIRRLLPDTYFLVDESNSASKTLFAEAPAGTYKAISFLIGVDSLHNVSGAQAGVLDPIHDMFWTWNTGYIMAKMEGTSPQSNLPNQKIEYHIGGFKGAQSALRTVTFSFPQAYTIEPLKGVQVNIAADVLKWFDAVRPLSIAAAPTATAPGLLTSQFADNYTTMFTITSVQQP